jgi:acetolactate synthase-1/2/3 large subunit
MFAGMTKWVAQIDRADRVGEYVAQAFAVATAGRPGPVVLAMPEDMLVERVDLPPARPVPSVEIHPSAEQLSRLRALLAEAERPLLIVGGSRWTAAAGAAVERFAAANDLPVVASFRRQDRFDNAHPGYCGDLGLGVNPRLRTRVRDADLLVVFGARLGEVPTGGYGLLDIPVPRQKLVHVHADAGELGRVYQPTLGINATPVAFAARLGELEPVVRPAWSAWRAESRQDYERWQVPPAQPGRFDLGEAVRAMSARLPPDTIFANGAGNFSVWLHRFHRYRRLGTQLAPTSGSMGYGVPAAIAARLRHPDRAVICLAGDGDFQMTLQELSTAAQHGAAVVFVVIDNGTYGTIRMHQERHYPGRVSGTDLFNPDFVALAKAYGAEAELIEATADFMPALERALACGRMALLHVRVDPEALTPAQTLTEIREEALRR